MYPLHGFYVLFTSALNYSCVCTEWGSPEGLCLLFLPSLLPTSSLQQMGPGKGWDGPQIQGWARQRLGEGKGKIRCPNIRD